MENKYKPRILLVNESSIIASGYGTYGMEVMSRLQATGKYELAELACYITPSDTQHKRLPWKVYANHPEAHHQQEVDEFNKKRTNEFGEFSFEKTCLQFKPDVVWSIRDWWYDEFIERSPFRPYYKWVVMPTVDAAPQHEQWIATYMNADAVFTYSDWGQEILRQESSGLINTVGSAPPGADLERFFPMDKKALRSKFNFDGDEFIIGTVMRNQGRKLYPELIQAFAEYLKQAPPELAAKTYLYLHTSYPDQGWDIPRLIKQNGVGHKTLVTYKCQLCKAVFPSFFMDAVGPCDSCGQPAARMPSVQEGVDRSTLAKIINLFDVYVQYANSEGFGMPMVEAASCGVPVFATDYSAMSDVVRKVNGYPIRVSSYHMDSDFGCMRATPDNQDLINKWIKFFGLSDSERMRKCQQARQGVEKNYTWEQTTNRWMTVFDRLMSSTHSPSMEIVSNPSHIQDVPSAGKTLKGKQSSQPSVDSSHPLKGSKSYQNRKETNEYSANNKSDSLNVMAGLTRPVLGWDTPPRIHQPQPIVRNFESNEEMVRWAILNVLGQPEMLNSYMSVRLIRDLNWGMTMKNLTGGNYANEQSFLATRGNLQKFAPDDMIQELVIMCEHRNKWEKRRWEAL